MHRYGLYVEQQRKTGHVCAARNTGYGISDILSPSLRIL
jgi:hypothetical protein